jgi:hypothetical protein
MKSKYLLVKLAAFAGLLSILNPQPSTLFAQPTAFSVQSRLGRHIPLANLKETSALVPAGLPVPCAQPSSFPGSNGLPDAIEKNFHFADMFGPPISHCWLKAA